MPKDYETTAPDTGIVFYPGGLVDYHAYLPLVTELSKKGIACFIAKMPLNFAFMDMDAAEKFLNMHPEITKWYLAGHSLGGAMAASYISKHPEDYKGLILLAAYSTHNLSNKNLNIISIRGSNDGVIKLNLYEKEKENLPEIGNGFTEIIIHGGNHAQFGNYGEQKGDNQAEISAKEQQKITATEILHWMGIE